MSITAERMEKALTFLATTDDTAADLKAQVARKEYGCKLARSRGFLAAEGSVEARKAQAECSEGVQAAEDEYARAIVEFEKVKAKRATEELIVEVWRSVNSNRRQAGHL